MKQVRLGADDVVVEIIDASFSQPGDDLISISDEIYEQMSAVIMTDRIQFKNGAVVSYPLPPPGPFVPHSISDRQFFQQLAMAGIITQDDALASNAAVIPPPLLAIINQMPADQQFNAKMIISGATIYNRADPLTISIGTAYGWTSDQIDAFFTAAAAL